MRYLYSKLDKVDLISNFHQCKRNERIVNTMNDYICKTFVD